MSALRDLDFPLNSRAGSAPRRATPLIDAEERLARLRLARSLNVGPRTYAQLMRRYGTAVSAVEALPTLAARGGRTDYVTCPEADITAELAAGQDAGATLVTLGELHYPALLAAIEPAPPVLWMLGDLGVFKRSAIAIVGARNASALGQRTARRLARELGSTGHVIVSGLARGIDAAAHEAALETGTIAVLAGGLDQPYPAENVNLAGRIAETGALISEVPFGVAPIAKHFPRRNRLISGLARGVVLIEAAARSGSLITAQFALEQGREAMACPGAADDPRATGCNALIRDGAPLIRHSGDIEDAIATAHTLQMAEEGNEFDFDAEMFSEGAMRDDYDALADFDEEGGDGDQVLAEQIMELVGPQPIEIDEIARQCGVDAADLSLAILELDLAGRIEIQAGGMITRSYHEP